MLCAHWNSPSHQCIPQSIHIITWFSIAVRVDISPPVTGVVRDGILSDVDQSYSSSLTTVEANWNGFYDYESSIAQYAVSVYRQLVGETGADVAYRTVVDGDIDQISLTHFSFTNGDRIFVEVEVTNGAGLMGVARSDSYVIDLTPPQVSYINDAEMISDFEYQSSNSSYSVSWNVTDMESGIARIEGAIFEVHEGRRMRVYPSSLQPLVSLSPFQSTWTISDGLSLNAGARYFASLAVTNGAGIRVVYESNGIVVDPTPPIIQRVYVSTDTYISDSESAGVTVIADPDRIEVQWVAFDPESGISGYRVGIVDGNGTFVVNVSFGDTQGGVIEGAASVLNSDETYRVAIVAINLGRQESELAYSNPFR